MNTLTTDPRVKTALIIAAVTFVCTSSLAAMHQLTRERIAHSEIIATTARLNEIIPPTLYDNAIHNDTVTLTHPALAPDQPAKIWRARLNNRPTAAVLTVTAPDGYNGNIISLVGIDVAGNILGVRVLSHRETPGLGDDIELPRSSWIRSFDNLSMDALPDNQWQVRRDGGYFDQFTGATITPRAVVRSVYRALHFFDNHVDTVFCESNCEAAVHDTKDTVQHNVGQNVLGQFTHEQ